MASREESLPSEVQSQIEGFQTVLSRVDRELKAWLAAPPKQLDAQLQPLQRANAHCSVARAMVELFVVYLRTQGLASKEHPINKDAERVKLYQKKIQKAESAAYVAANKSSTEINIAAANRFITHAIPELTAQQKQALKQAHTAAAARQNRQPEAPPAQREAKRRRLETEAHADAFLAETLGDALQG